jgi:hypothetical protein
MTVGQLREALSRFDDAMPVMVDGYERGVDYPTEPQAIEVYERNTALYYGRFETVEEGSSSETLTVVVIPRWPPRWEDEDG